MKRLGILISGRGSNMIAILKAVKSGKINAIPSIVISNKPNAAGLQYAKRQGIPTMVIESRGFSGSRAKYDSLIEKALKKHGVSPQNGIVCLAGFMRILGPAFVNKYKNRILNIHPALLPSFPGLDAQAQAIQYGAKISGCTVHFVDSGVDTGPVILQAAVNIDKNDTAKTLAAKIIKKEHQTYPKAVQLLASGKIRVVKNKVRIL